jgi:hypothetical protein
VGRGVFVAMGECTDEWEEVRVEGRKLVVDAEKQKTLKR